MTEPAPLVPRLARAHRLKVARLAAGRSIATLAGALRAPIEVVVAVEAGERPARPDYVRALVQWGFTPVVLVTGGREYMDRATVGEALLALHPARVVHGACPTGADRLAREWAESRGRVGGSRVVPDTPYPADWARYGRAAGPMRNGAMLEAEDAALDLVVAFPGGDGTADMVRRARNVGVPVLIVEK